MKVENERGLAWSHLRVAEETRMNDRLKFQGVRAGNIEGNF